MKTSLVLIGPQLLIHNGFYFSWIFPDKSNFGRFASRLISHPWIAIDIQEARSWLSPSSSGHLRSCWSAGSWSASGKWLGKMRFIVDKVSGLAGFRNFLLVKFLRFLFSLSSLFCFRLLLQPHLFLLFFLSLFFLSQGLWLLLVFSWLLAGSCLGILCILAFFFCLASFLALALWLLDTAVEAALEAAL